MPHSKALLCCCFHLPYTGRWYRVSWAYATCPRLGGRRLRGPGTSVGCHTTGCRPGRGLWRSAGNTRPPPLLCTRTSTRGKPEASSPPPPPADTESGEKKKKELSRHKCKRVCALVFWVWTSWSGDCSYSLHAGLLPRLITEVGLIWASTRSWATDQGKVLKKKTKQNTALSFKLMRTFCVFCDVTCFPTLGDSKWRSAFIAAGKTHVGTCRCTCLLTMQRHCWQPYSQDAPLR